MNAGGIPLGPLDTPTYGQKLDLNTPFGNMFMRPSVTPDNPYVAPTMNTPIGQGGMGPLSHPEFNGSLGPLFMESILNPINWAGNLMKDVEIFKNPTPRDISNQYDEAIRGRPAGLKDPWYGIIRTLLNPIGDLFTMDASKAQHVDMIRGIKPNWDSELVNKAYRELWTPGYIMEKETPGQVMDEIRFWTNLQTENRQRWGAPSAQKRK